MSTPNIPRRGEKVTAFRLVGHIPASAEGLQFQFSVSQFTEANIPYDDEDLGVLADLLHEAYVSWKNHLETKNEEVYSTVTSYVHWDIPTTHQIDET